MFARAHGVTDFRLLDVVRKIWDRVSSLPAIRYGVLWDQGDPADQDDVMTSV